MMKQYLATVFFLTTIMIAQCQSPGESDQLTSPNALVFQGNPFFYQGMYERALFQRGKHTFNVKTGLGVTNAPDYYGHWGHLSVGMLRGIGKHRLDLDLGPALIKTSINEFWISAHAGYRFQTKHFLAKIGIGSPEGIYFGLGLAF